MSNLTIAGEKFLWTYIADYQQGLLNDRAAKAYLNCCFEDLK